jgi:hypothetical protein
VDIPPPTPAEQIAALATCLRAGRIFMAYEEIGWLIDPPPYDFGYPPLRQWQFAFAELPANVRLDFRQLDGDRPATRLLTFTAERASEAAFEFVTDGMAELALRHDRDRLENGRVKQRWLVPIQVISVGREPSALVRAGSKLGVVSSDGIVTLDFETGRVDRRAGRFELAREPGAELVATETRRFIVGDAGLIAAPMAREERAAVPSPFSVALPRGRVAALHGDRLVIAIPYGAG